MYDFKNSPAPVARRSPFATLLSGVALASLAACADDPAALDDTQQLQAEPYTFAPGKVTFTEALELVETKITAAQSRAESQPKASTPWSSLAASWSSRARLSGDLSDYIEAQTALDEAFARSAEGAGPWLNLAAYAFTVHRLDTAQEALDRAAAAVLIDDSTRASIEGLRGDIDLQRGEMAMALPRLEAAEALDPSSRTAARLGLWYWRSGDLERADGYYAEGASRYHGLDAEVHAWFELQRGLLDLDRGQYDEALTHYLDANHELSGYFLVEEHVAEILVLTDRPNEALFVYEDVVERTGSPEFMDAIAGLYAEVGDEATSREWIARADAAYTADRTLLPEAAVGHALGHYLEFGPPQTALELATDNFELRPNPHAQADLALALAQNDQPEAAREHIDAAMAGQWRSFDLYESAQTVYLGLGEASLATEARDLACELAPLRCDDLP